MIRSIRIAGLMLLGFVCRSAARGPAAEAKRRASAKKLNVAVLTGGHHSTSRTS